MQIKYRDAWVNWRTKKVYDAVSCPLCKATATWPCRSLAEGRASSTAHADRWAKYIEWENRDANKQENPIPTQNLGGLTDDPAPGTGQGRTRTPRNRSW